MNENCIVKRCKLLSDDGRLENPGYSTALLLEYERSRIKAAKWRIKEWDYYLINDDKFAVALTLSDMGYLGLVSVSVVDLTQAKYKSTSVLVPFPMGRFKMPENSTQGVSVYENARVSLRFEVKGGVRKLLARFTRFDGADDLSFEAILTDEPRDSIVIATPWKEDPLAFYYNQKIVAMTAQGRLVKGDIIHKFEPDTSFGLLDWGRGVWTRDNTWFWGAAQGWQDGLGCNATGGHRFGLNLGYGFGDTSAASENIVFVDGIGHKLGRVIFDIPLKTLERSSTKAKRIARRYALLKPWHIYDDEQRLDLTFMPAVDRADYSDIGLVVSDQHQVFGLMSGRVTLDDGSEFLISELTGFAEVVRNKY